MMLFILIFLFIIFTQGKFILNNLNNFFFEGFNMFDKISLLLLYMISVAIFLTILIYYGSELVNKPCLINNH